MYEQNEKEMRENERRKIFFDKIRKKFIRNLFSLQEEKQSIIFFRSSDDLMVVERRTSSGGENTHTGLLERVHILLVTVQRPLKERPLIQVAIRKTHTLEVLKKICNINNRG